MKPTRLLFAPFLALLLALLAVGCSVEPGAPQSVPPDAAVDDSGTADDAGQESDAGPGDAGVPDAGPGDAGPTDAGGPPMHRYFVKGDWLTARWNYTVRPAATVMPVPAVFRTGSIDDNLSFRRSILTEQWQWFWVDLMALAKHGKPYAQLDALAKKDMVRAFAGASGSQTAFNNFAGTDNKNCYPCGETSRGEDPKHDPLICAGNTVVGVPVQNAKGRWMVKLRAFDSRQPPPPATLDILKDPRVLWATNISDRQLPDGSYPIFEFPQLHDGTSVPYPYLAVEDVYYPLEELEEYGWDEPQRSLYNPPRP